MKMTFDVYKSDTKRIIIVEQGVFPVENLGYLGTTEIEIKEPKKKVMKWLFVLSNGLGGELFISKHKMTEEYATEQFTVIQKIESTGEEVEE